MKNQIINSFFDGKTFKIIMNNKLKNEETGIFFWNLAIATTARN